ncbi:MAG: PH-like domain-containing protein [Lacisediminihabitans sp.]
MDKVLPTIVVVALILLLLGGMYLGWRSRQRRQSDLPRPDAVPADVGTELLTSELFYVATTHSGEPLNRVAVSGLGYRARASVTVAERGIILAIAGEPEAFIPATDLGSVERATWTIDRVVETGGLVVISWLLGSTLVDSYFRMVEPADPTALIEALQQIIVGVGSQGSDA